MAVVPFGANDTVPGTVRSGLLLDSVTVPPPAADTVTVHVLDIPVQRAEGVHASELKT